jgi:uncharacterized membrane protein
MKKYILILSIFTLFSCESTTYEELQDAETITGAVTYNAHVKSVIENNCLMCHSEGGVSSFRPLGTYVQLKEAVLTTNLLDRIQRQNGETGQMPQTGRMSQADINLILQWNADGLLEN